MSPVFQGFFYTMENDKKALLLEKTLDHFLKYGSKNITMDDIAEEFGLSKKTLYTLFKNKEALLLEAVDLLWKKFIDEVNEIIESNQNPLQKIIAIYIIAIQNISTIDPIFLYSLKKYHRAVMEEYQKYKKQMRDEILLPLLQQAKDEKLIIQTIDIVFFSAINFDDIDEKLWKYKVFENYTNQEILDYFITLKLKGIVTKDCFNLL